MRRFGYTRKNSFFYELWVEDADDSNSRVIIGHVYYESYAERFVNIMNKTACFVA